jgi:hypothetical protein
LNGFQTINKIYFFPSTSKSMDELGKQLQAKLQANERRFAPGFGGGFASGCRATNDDTPTTAATSADDQSIAANAIESTAKPATKSQHWIIA